MKLKFGYYPILDMLLALRQAYSLERFKPFIPEMETIMNRLSNEDVDFIQKAGDMTRGWLHTIEKVIPVTINGVATPEEFILKLLKEPEALIKTQDFDYDIKLFYKSFSSLWQNLFNTEISKNNKAIFDRLLELDEKISTTGLKNYILNTTDRVIETEEDILKVFIKPEHNIEIKNLENVIIMPSIFASRAFTFWHNNNDYVFYFSLNSSKNENIEPSDQLLIKTLALNDKTRLKMLRLLSTKNYSTADMAEALEMNSSTVSRHFKLFKDAGYVDIFTQEGNSIYYSINLEEIKKSYDLILSYIKNEE